MRLIDNVYMLLITNFKGVTVINRDGVYQRLREVVQFIDSNITKEDDDNDTVIFDFGTIQCIFRMTWGSSNIDNKRERLCEITMMGEILTIANTFGIEKPTVNTKCLVNRNGDKYIATYTADGCWHVDGDTVDTKALRDDTWIALNEISM